MTTGIDLNRGVTIKMDPSSGARVLMYKDAPGTFLNAHGVEVADTLAARCGFPVKELKQQRAKREALAKASEEIEAAFETERENKVAGKVVKEEDGYKILQFAFGRCWVHGPDGEKMHDKPRTKGEAIHLLKVLKAGPADAEAPDAETEAEAEAEEEDTDASTDGGSNGT